MFYQIRKNADIERPLQHVIFSNTANLYNTYVTAIALDSIDWRYYLIFVGLNIIYSFCWYFFGVETRGRTLEELDEVFNAKWPPRAALKKQVMVRQQDGHLAGLHDDELVREV
jgi:hypothetical protein